MNYLFAKSQALFYPKSMFETSVLSENFLYMLRKQGEKSQWCGLRSLKIMVLSMHDFISDQMNVQILETTNLSCLFLDD